ncbi:acyl-CoA dehydrogenase family protein [Thermaurantiacus sp.]
MGAFGLTEPDAGPDAAAIRTRTPRGFRITGTKMKIKLWITSAPLADLLVVWARCCSEGGDPRLRAASVR